MGEASAALADATRRLVAVSDTPRLDAELLLAHALGVTREALLLAPPAAVPDSFVALVGRRLADEPVAYIVGRRAFWTIELAVGPGVLVPRADSETLIEAALAHFGTVGPRTILDLGIGSGALLLAALDQWPDARGMGIDRSEAALACARSNAERLGMADRAELRIGDWDAGIEQAFDLVLCNPPYVESGAILPREVADHEPASALFSGADGLDDLRRIAPRLPALIAPGGMAAIEIGAAQGADALALVRAAGCGATLRQDLGGRDRCVVAHPPAH